MSICKTCGAEIRWIKTPAGTPMPCDDKLVYFKITGTYKDRVVVESAKYEGGVVYACTIVSGGDGYDGTGYIPHWATCPAADQLKAKVKKC